MLSAAAAAMATVEEMEQYGLSNSASSPPPLHPSSSRGDPTSSKPPSLRSPQPLPLSSSGGGQPMTALQLDLSGGGTGDAADPVSGDSPAARNKFLSPSTPLYGSQYQGGCGPQKYAYSRPYFNYHSNPSSSGPHSYGGPANCGLGGLHHHGPQPTKGYKCKMCQQLCFSKHDLARHNASAHKQDPRPYRCEHCGRQFSTGAYLGQHRRIHLGIKPYVCRFCERRFTQLSHVQQHERIHTGEKPYRCPACLKSFTQMSNLQSHQRQHMKGKPCRCEHCFMCFDLQEELDTHVQAKHAGHKYSKILVCPICGKNYNSETYLNKHIHKHKESAAAANMSVMAAAVNAVAAAAAHLPRHHHHHSHSGVGSNHLGNQSGPYGRLPFSPSPVAKPLHLEHVSGLPGSSSNDLAPSSSYPSAAPVVGVNFYPSSSSPPPPHLLHPPPSTAAAGDQYALYAGLYGPYHHHHPPPGPPGPLQPHPQLNPPPPPYFGSPAFISHDFISHFHNSQTSAVAAAAAATANSTVGHSSTAGLFASESLDQTVGFSLEPRRDPVAALCMKKEEEESCDRGDGSASSGCGGGGAGVEAVLGGCHLLSHLPSINFDTSAADEMAKARLGRAGEASGGAFSAPHSSSHQQHQQHQQQQQHQQHQQQATGEDERGSGSSGSSPTVPAPYSSDTGPLAAAPSPYSQANIDMATAYNFMQPLVAFPQFRL